jgi:replication-associated recombination protein RarA
MSDNYELRTAGGYPMDEVRSALQKEIRRGNIEASMYWALELNTHFPDYVWRTLVTIACEDIGPANPTLVGTIASLALAVWQMRYTNKRKIYPDAILGYAVLEMARSPKSRQADDLVNETLRRMRSERLEVPDYALDSHTEKGREMGRNSRFFWQEGSKLEDEVDPADLGMRRFVPWTDEEGDGYYTPDGKSASPWSKKEDE